MSTTATTYRKTQQGEWVAFGPAATVRPGAVTVTKKDGTLKTEQVTRVGKTFTVGGAAMVYGYLAKSATPAHQGSGASRPATSATRTCRACGDAAHKCDECGERWPVTAASDMSGIGGCVCGTCARSGALSFA